MAWNGRGAEQNRPAKEKHTSAKRRLSEEKKSNREKA